MSKNFIAPEGAQELMFSDCKKRKEAQSLLSAILEENGYYQVVTPALEYFDLFSEEADDLFTLTDVNGKIMALRPESTKPISRMIASRIAELRLPVKLFYCQDTFRRTSAKNEFLQLGAELIGTKGFDSDIEILQLAHKCLLAGGKECVLEISHIGLFESLVANLETDKATRKKIFECIAFKRFSELEDILTLKKIRNAQKLLELPNLFGGIEVFKKAQEIFSDDESKKILFELEETFLKLSKTEDNIKVDLGLVNDYNYYTGIVFKGYNANGEVLSGGRYDNLYSEFDLDLGAVGFAIDVDKFRNSVKKRDKLMIALTKGRLEEKTVEKLEKSGVDCSALSDKGRKLIVSTEDFDVVFAKANDVVTFVEMGACDLGIVGKDTLSERNSSVYEIRNLNFGKCRFALCAKSGSDFWKGFSKKIIATKYPFVARKFFASKKMDIDIIKIEGSVELAPLLDIADGIVDIVETGATLRANGLEVIEDILDISARLICNTASLKLCKDKILKLAEKL